MDEVFNQIDKLGKAERRVAMVTLVATKGTSPKKEGMKLWVGEAGRILGSVTIGGCVDAQVIEESEAALTVCRPRLFSIALGEEDAWEGGFTCAGTIEVMIEPIDLSNPDDRLLTIYRSINDVVKNGKCVVLATRLEQTEAKLLIFDDGRLSGTLGDDALDREAREIAGTLIQKQNSRTVELSSGSSSTEVFLEFHGPAPTLIIFGAGPVSMHLVNLAREMGMRVVVVDGRPRFATSERFPNADELLIGIPSEIAGKLSYTSSTFVVLTAHDYKYDIPVLKTVLKTDAVYIGLLGSKKRGRSIIKFLSESGLDEQLLQRVRVPTGLDIGAQTAAEIALSILAEAVAVKAARHGMPMSES
ncbi:MAG: XdhC family protein [Acidobacteria bacterium]|nr:XdhC family protein [Acidobacteriota bacterium]